MAGQPDEERRHSVTEMLRVVAFSPYDWKYTLQLPRYLSRPGRGNRTGLHPPPASRTLLPDAEADVKVVAGGDFIQTTGNRVPELDGSLRTLIGSADYFFANCEAPLLPADDADRRVVTFGMPVAYLEGIMDQIDLPRDRYVFSVATNHARDQEEHVFRDGVRRLEEEVGAHAVGLHHDDAEPYTTLEHGSGLSFGVAAWTHLMNGESVLHPRKVVNRKEDIPPVDWQGVKEREGLDMLVGMPHWDRSYQHFPNAETRRFAHELVHGGFHLLLGGHPHVAQPVEVIEHALCVYSRGNFCSKHYLPHETRLRPLVEIDLTADGDVVGYTMHFYVQYKDDGDLTLVPLSKLPQERRGRYQDLIATLFDGSTGT